MHFSVAARRSLTLALGGLAALACIGDGTPVGPDSSGYFPSDPTVLFESDWSTATGTSDDALRDTGQPTPWIKGLSDGGVLEIVNAASAGLSHWPTANALKVTCMAAGNGNCKAEHADIDNAWSAPPIGQSLYYRVYLQVDSMYNQNSHLPSEHPFENGNGGGSHTDWVFTTEAHSNGEWSIEWRFANSDWPNNRWCVDGTASGCTDGDKRNRPTLKSNHTYMIEIQFEHTSETHFSLRPRVWDVAGDSLVYGPESFVNVNRTATMAESGVLTFNTKNWLQLMIGTSGVTATAGEIPPGFKYSEPMYYWGAVAVCANDWCGPHGR
jgi:hypothetical protein